MLIKRCKELFYTTITYGLSIFGLLPLVWKGSKKKVPIVLIHGYLNSSAVWIYLGNKLAKKSHSSIYAMNLGYPFLSIEEYARRLKVIIEQIYKECGHKRVIIIGHSMGGLVASYYATTYQSPMDIVDIVTLATPFKGTVVAKIGVGQCARQMQIGSDFLQKLEENIKKDRHRKYFFIATKKDHIVKPFDSALLSHDPKNSYVFENLGHASLLFSKRVYRKIYAWIFNDLIER